MKTLLTEEELRCGIQSLAESIREHYQGRPVTIVGIMIGSIVLLADLIRLLDMPLHVELVQTRSYRSNATEPGTLEVNIEMLTSDLKGRNILLVDDIFDTGHTLTGLLPHLEALEPTDIRTAVLLRKKERCEVTMQPDFVGFDVPDEFVVGYGLDYNDLYRNLPYIGVLEPAELAAH